MHEMHEADFPKTAAQDLLPHGGPAHLVPEILDYTEDQLLCRARFPADSPLARDGQVQAWLCAEPAAQAAATHLGLVEIDRGTTVHHLEGFLTGVKNVRVLRALVPVEQDLTIQVTPRGGARGLFKYDFAVDLDGELVSRGQISTFVKTR